MSLSRFISAAILGLGSLAAVSGVSFADTFHVSTLGPGVQSSPDSTSVNTFTGFTGTTNFNGSSITGTYSGDYVLKPADIYGGANGTGQYPFQDWNQAMTISLSSSVNYFGLWISALDAGNTIDFYDGSTLLFTFAPTDYPSLLSGCPGDAACGNPNSDFLGANNTQKYLFFNFYDTDGTFDKIVLNELPGGFESDNHTIGNLSSDPSGTPLNPPSPVPEPSTFVLGLSGLAGLVGSRHQLMARLRRSS